MGTVPLRRSHWLVDCENLLVRLVLELTEDTPSVSPKHGTTARLTIASVSTRVIYAVARLIET